jgi:hypothetical protein
MIEQAAWILQQYPWMQHIVAVMVVSRIVFKPAFKILARYVELTVEKDDNKKLHKIMDSKAYKMAAFIIDMLASVKLPEIKKGK